jgi:hypothetical protein
MGFWSWLGKKDKIEKKKCFCGKDRFQEDCHDLEHELPQHERPDPD